MVKSPLRMPPSWLRPEGNDFTLTNLAKQGLRDLMIGSWSGVMAGISSAIFLLVLAQIDQGFRLHPVQVLWLPVVGLISAALYHYWGADSSRGTRLVVESIHTPDRTIPLRMAPLVLAGTWLTHLAGGSAGREGTAVQMGGSLALAPAKRWNLDHDARRLLAVAGIAGGFGAVFGTPWAGALFAIEATSRRWFTLNAILASVTAAWVGDRVCRLLGVVHHSYPVFVSDGLPPGSVAAIGVVMALIATLFVGAVRQIPSWIKDWPWWLKPIVGGSLVIAMTLLVGNVRYNGLSLPLLADSVTTSVGRADFCLKLVFTVVTLGFGFKGGEVTPLFVIGATAANALAQTLGFPIAASAMLGFVTLCAAASGAPVACAIMAGELFGWTAVPWAMTAAVIAAAIGPAESLYGVRRPWVAVRGYFKTGKWSKD